MAKLIWGAAGSRTYEAGVDRGVLYIPGLAGVPWNGLRSVKESPNGGDPQPYYVDGLKYANVSAAEEFNATIEAFSSPEEFAVCDGSLELAAGLFVTQQPRKMFGLSYRTKIGNDINGLDLEYKIHLVYNALAAPADRNNSTTGSSADPLGLSWGISTLPPNKASGYRPTAHFVIDSRRIAKELLQSIEDILYGTDTMTPSLPPQDQLIDLFRNPGPV